MALQWSAQSQDLCWGDTSSSDQREEPQEPQDDTSLMLTSIKAFDGKQVIDFPIKISTEDFSWELFVFQKTISKQLPYVSRLPSVINRSNVQWFLDFYLEFHIRSGNSDFPEGIKKKFAHGTDLNFYDKQKNDKAKVENKKISTLEELDTIRTINKVWSFYI